MIRDSYYTLKRYLGGEKMTGREKVRNPLHYPTPGCNSHKEIVGERRGEILFKKYCFSGSHDYRRHNTANRLYWRTHPEEWEQLNTTYQ